MRFVDSTEPSLPSSSSTTTTTTAHTTGPQLLAAGLWRTATSSLQSAFESPTLSLSPSMHGAYIMPSNERMQLCVSACSASTPAHQRREILHALFDGYRASSDFPGMAFVDDLLDMYPSMRVVLNQRKSPQAWEKSVRGSLRFFSTRTYLVLTYWVPQSYWHHRLYRAYMDLARRRWGIEDVFTAEAYQVHNEWVREVCRERGREVVEWEPGMGWGPLCEVVGREVPRDAEGREDEFPNVNESEAIADLTKFLIKRGLKAWAVVVGVPTLVLGTAVYFARSDSSSIASYIASWKTGR